MASKNTVTNNSGDSWDLILKPKTGWFDINLKELWQYRDLVTMFVKRDFVTLYRQTIFGPLWYIIQPLFITLVFTVIFGTSAIQLNQIMISWSITLLVVFAGIILFSRIEKTFIDTV